MYSRVQSSTAIVLCLPTQHVCDSSGGGGNIEGNNGLEFNESQCVALRQFAANIYSRVSRVSTEEGGKKMVPKVVMMFSFF